MGVWCGGKAVDGNDEFFFFQAARLKSGGAFCLAERARYLSLSLSLSPPSHTSIVMMPPGLSSVRLMCFLAWDGREKEINASERESASIRSWAGGGGGRARSLCVSPAPPL